MKTVTLARVSYKNRGLVTNPGNEGFALRGEPIEELGDRAVYFTYEKHSPRCSGLELFMIREDREKIDGVDFRSEQRPQPYELDTTTKIEDIALSEEEAELRAYLAAFRDFAITSGQNNTTPLRRKTDQYELVDRSEINGEYDELIARVQEMHNDTRDKQCLDRGIRKILRMKQ